MIPKTHPRKKSLDIRHRLVNGFKQGLVAHAGLIAHGRGEAFDYLIGEKTISEARKAEEAAVALLLLAKKPVISVNGNTASLCPREVVQLAKTVNAGIEVNLFYRGRGREKKIAAILKKAGAKKVHGVGVKTKKIKNLASPRALIDTALWESDVVLVPLEDGDRTEALAAMGKKVIAIDLNPLSRTAQKATITIVDNIVRAMPNMIALAERLREEKREKVDRYVTSFNNKRNLAAVERLIRKSL